MGCSLLTIHWNMIGICSLVGQTAHFFMGITWRYHSRLKHVETSSILLSNMGTSCKLPFEPGKASERNWDMIWDMSIVVPKNSQIYGPNHKPRVLKCLFKENMRFIKWTSSYVKQHEITMRCPHPSPGSTTTLRCNDTRIFQIHKNPAWWSPNSLLTGRYHHL